MKKILSEATVRRFQALANIPGLRESHGRGQHEGGDYESGREDLEESMYEGEIDEYDLGGLMNEEDEGPTQTIKARTPEEKEAEEKKKEKAKADLLKKNAFAKELEKAGADEQAKMNESFLFEEEEDEDMPETPDAPEGDMGGEDMGAAAGGDLDKGKVESALEKALKAMAESLASDLNLDIDVVSGGEEAAAAPEMPPAAGGTPELPPPPAGGEEEMAAMTENVRRLVNKVEARVKQRIQRVNLEETLMRRVAARLLAASKKPVKADPKKPVKPTGKPVKKK